MKVGLEERLVSIGARLRQERSLYPLDLGDAKVLFRIDGVIFRVSDLAFEVVEQLLRYGESATFSSLISRHGRSSFDPVAKELIDLSSEGLLQSSSRSEPSVSDPRPRDAQPGGTCLLVSQTCNLSCHYCYAGGGSYGEDEKWMSPAVADAAIESLLARAPGRRVLTVIFFGGEPLLNFRLIRHVVDYCDRSSRDRDLEFRFSVTTNCTVLTDEILSFMVEHRFVVMASYDSARFQNRLRPYRHGAPSGSVVRKNIRRMVEAGLRLQIRGTVVRPMVERGFLRDFIQETHDLGVRELVLSTADCSTDSKASGLALGEEDKNALQQLFLETTQENLRKSEAGQEQRIVFDPHVCLIDALATGTVRRLAGCGACVGMTAVSTEGKLYPCHRFVGKESFIIGSVEQGVSEEAVERFFADHRDALEDRCEDCFARRLCGGMCPHGNAMPQGGFSPPTRAQCSRYRRTVEHAVRLSLDLRDRPPEVIRNYSVATRHLL